MPVDYTMYDRMADTWWDDYNPHALLRTGMNPARFGYFRSVLQERLGLDPSTLQLLDVGCGGGFLTEEFASLGCHVTGIDPSERSIRAAQEHANAHGLEIVYVVGRGESLPFEGGAFDVVSCCDVLEHIVELKTVVAQIARVLRPGGILLYDTINRTLRSRMALISIAQEWRLTRVMPAHLHDWRMFITPSELEAMLRRNGLNNREIVGLSPRSNPLALLRALIQTNRGSISHAELGRRMRLSVSNDTSASYAGYAVKDAY